MMKRFIILETLVVVFIIYVDVYNVSRMISFECYILWLSVLCCITDNMIMVCL